MWRSFIASNIWTYSIHSACRPFGRNSSHDSFNCHIRGRNIFAFWWVPRELKVMLLIAMRFVIRLSIESTVTQYCKMADFHVSPRVFTTSPMFITCMVFFSFCQMSDDLLEFHFTNWESAESMILTISRFRDRSFVKSLQPINKSSTWKSRQIT